MTVLGKPTGEQENQLLRMLGNSHSGMKMLLEIENKKHDLLEDKVSDWLQIWIAALGLT